MTDSSVLIWFLNFVARGQDSPYAELCVQLDRLGEIGDDDLAKIPIRKEKEPFRDVQLANGETCRVWCASTERQLDLKSLQARIDHSDPQTAAKSRLVC